MNYIAEIKLFFDWLQFNPLPADAQALWHTLMHLNNKCAVKVGEAWVWCDEFSVSNTTILSILNISAKQLHIMRNVLIQSGRIVYKKGKGNQCGSYSLIPFECNNYTQMGIQTGIQMGIQMGIQTGKQTSSLINYNNTDTDNNKRSDARVARAFSLYEETIGVLSPAVISFITECRLPDDVMCFAIELSKGAKSPFKYMCKILDNWERTGIKTLEDAKRDNVRYKAGYNPSDMRKSYEDEGDFLEGW